jgi:hypothetical protein
VNDVLKEMGMTDEKPTVIENETFLKYKVLLDRVKVGMNRAEVEQIFKNSRGGIQGNPITIYHEAPGVKIEVPFDRTGGWIPHTLNRVCGAVRMFITVAEHGPSRNNPDISIG